MIYNLDLSKVRKISHNLDLSKVSKMSILRLSALKSSHLRSNHSAVPKTNKIKQIFLGSWYKMLNLPPKEFKEIAKIRAIRNYKSMSEV